MNTGSSSIIQSLEITVISAENLRLNGKPVKKDTFVVVRIDNSANPKSTKADFEGGNCPHWNEKLDIDMPVNSHYITLEVVCRIGSGNRIIGQARIPVSEFMDGYAPANYLHFLSYRLRDMMGQKNGIVNISVKVKSNADYVNPRVKQNVPVNGYTSSSSGFTFAEQPAWGVPARGVATGVPVWCASRA